MKAPRHGNDGNAQGGQIRGSLADLYALGIRDAQRPGNIGAGLKVLDMLMARSDFRPPAVGRA